MWNAEPISELDTFAMEDERRHAYRILVTNQAVLVLEQQTLLVALADVSADGFAIESPQALPIAPGKTYLLRTTAGWFQTLAVRSAATSSGYRYGLKRTADLEDPRQTQAVFQRTPKALRYYMPDSRLKSNSVLVMLGLGALLAAYVILSATLPDVLPEFLL